MNVFLSQQDMIVAAIAVIDEVTNVNFGRANVAEIETETVIIVAVAIATVEQISETMAPIHAGQMNAVDRVTMTARSVTVVGDRATEMTEMTGTNRCKIVCATWLTMEIATSTIDATTAVTLCRGVTVNRKWVEIFLAISWIKV